ncbi:type II secretion system GspH family protein [Jatrophihabitans cynanchi]|jgi:prepilin-type N-terminal cleavage/methylation domain-containing protein|uniref:Type II secretion system GspH family protein n=1 Tax=Jatrophihabitans cynanchi TaxID=2944128 RepID=A0ABY7K0J7_9ACTN|nr:type II secretion system protein [Jatrophihabitans sp. SB3-54]WAX57112.1 type II secretion system GspH family protein [Jatrophihabitans sp. SB3-54]
MSRLQRLNDDRGDTLIEVIAAVFVLGIAAVAIVSAMTMSVKISDYHRKQADASAVLHNYAESLVAGYRPCTSANSQPYTLAARSGFAAPSVTVSYWTGTSFGSTSCPAGGDPGVQRVQLAVSSIDSRASETLTVVVRQP